jgi:hypothetical protein
MPDLTDQIESESAKPQSVTTDGTTVVRRSIQDQIAADKYLKGNEAVASPLTAIHRFKIVSPSSVGET